jgi:hypothetical protein
MTKQPDEPSAVNPNQGEPMTKPSDDEPNPRGHMTLNATMTHPTLDPHPNGALMANTHNSSESSDLNPSGALMTDSKNQISEDPNPHGAQMTEPDEPIPDTLPMLTPHDAARAMLTGVACELGLDEVRVLVRIGERLKAGGRQYGRLHLASDMRAFRNMEAREELEDALVYLACAWLKAETREVA